MKSAVVSLNSDKMRGIIQILGAHNYDIDTSNPDFVVTYGGDGTILYSERRYPGIPKITVRGSPGGYRCLYNESDLENVISKVDNGEYSITEESKLETEFEGDRYLSLNETQLHNSSPIKAVRFSIYADNQQLFGGDIIGDGAVIATPFGSTAYYSSVGGNKFNNGIGVVLNNPYKVKYRYPMVIGEDIEIDIEILKKESKDTNDGLLLFDNDDNTIIVKGGDNINIKRSKDTAKFVSI